MKHTRIVAAFLIALSTLTALVGCNPEPKSPVDTTPQTVEETTAADETAADETADTTVSDAEDATDPADTEADTEPDTSETEAPSADDMTEMQAKLDELLANKTQVRFDEDGEFRVMILSDLHMYAGGAPLEVMKYIKQIMEKEDPDFVILNGDNVVDSGISTTNVFKRTLKGLANYLEQEGIYWMHVFGNHDSELKLSMEEQQAIYESYDYCLSKDTYKELSGVGNYVIPVYGSTGDEVKFALWGLDSGSYLSAEEQQALFPSGVTGFVGYGGTNYDYIHYDQIEWYRESSMLMESCFGHKIPGLMAFHIPLQEFYTAWENREGLEEWTGSRNEAVCSSAYNSGLFEVLRQRGDIKAVTSGHDHVNDYMVNYAGIKLCYASTVTTTTYGGPLGTRMFVIRESDPSDVQTYMSYLFEEEENLDLPALSGVIEDFEGEAPAFSISGFDGAADSNARAEIAEGKGVNGSNALAVHRTVWASPHNTEVIWDIDVAGSIGENQYLLVWMDFATNDIDLRKGSFGFLANNVNDRPYRTDNQDTPTPFYYKAEGSDQWITMKTGDDGCFGAAQDSSVKGLKGWFAFPLENMPRGSQSPEPETAVTGLYFYMSPAAESDINKPVYIDEIQLVADYRAIQ